MTPLYIACENENIEVFKILIEQEGVDVNFVGI